MSAGSSLWGLASLRPSSLSRAPIPHEGSKSSLIWRLIARIASWTSLSEIFPFVWLITEMSMERAPFWFATGGQLLDQAQSTLPHRIVRGEFMNSADQPRRGLSTPTPLHPLPSIAAHDPTGSACTFPTACGADRDVSIPRPIGTHGA